MSAGDIAIRCADGSMAADLLKMVIVNAADCSDYIDCTNKDESIESLIKRVIVEDADGNLAINVCGCECEGGGGGGLVAVTYAELVALIGASGLTPGQMYLLTDFATKHYFTSFDSDMWELTTLADINTGATEPIILLATSANNIDSRVYSPTYPQDIIHYDWNPDNWLNDGSFSADQANIVSGWKGVITFRHDTVKDIYTGYDFRNVKYRRWKLNPPAYSALTAYDKRDIVIHLGSIYISLQGANTNHIGTSNGWWTKIVDSTITKYLSWSKDYCNNIDIDANDYQDFYTFNGADERNRSIHLEPIIDSIEDLNYGGTKLNNIVFIDYCDAVTIDSGCFCTTFGYFTKNTFLGKDCTHNIFGAVNTCVFGVGYYGNVINSITYCDCGSSMSSNYIGEVCQYNIIGIGFSNNMIGASFNYCTIGSYVDSCTIKNSLTQCQIDSYVNNLDLTGATIVYGNYNKRITVDAGGTYRVIYIDAGGAQQIAAATT